MCKYCEEGEPLINTRDKLSTKRDFYPGIEVYIENSELSITAVADAFEPNYQDEDVEITYCPMCGKRLK